MDPKERHAQLRRDKSDLLTEIALEQRAYPPGTDFLIEKLAHIVGTKIVSAHADVRTMLGALEGMGLVIVPREPTTEMVAAGDAKVWADMLAAAPLLSHGKSRVAKGT